GPGNLTLYSYQKMQGRGFKNRAYWIEGETGLKRFPNGTEVILGIRPVIRVEIAFLTGMDIHPLSEKEVEEHENKVEEELDSFLQLEVNEDHVLRHVRGALPKRFEVPEGVREIDPKAFYDATGKMETIVLPKSLKNFPAFESKLTFLRRIEVDPENPFYSSLDGILYDKERTAVLRVPMAYPERVQLPKSVEEIREFSFAFSTILKGIEFPASCKTIRAHAFFNARIMTKLILPPSLKYIEQYAFCGATLNRQPLFIPRTVSWIGANAFENLKEGDLLFQSKKSLFGFPRGYDKRMLGQPPIENVKWAVDK
ncbi:MAG: leucine-rich repeat protein, partial [Bacilli bacterium]|nr:leucine-rich repeat protein [Bacilli bacterium]